ncbi:MAG TPA: hypothetical protein VF138_11800 [Caulobacteraceae bacterium]
MRFVNNSSAKLGAVTAVILGGLSLTACATPVDYGADIAALNNRVSAVEGVAGNAAAAAQAAAADARNANARIDALTTRVDRLEQTATVIRTPRN